MTPSSYRPRRRPAAPVGNSWGTRLNDYAFEQGLAHLQTVNAGQVHRLTTSQQLVGTLALYYTGGRLLFDLAELLTLPRKRRRASRK